MNWLRIEIGPGPRSTLLAAFLPRALEVAALAMLAATFSVQAATYLPVCDQELVDRSPVVVVARALGVSSRLSDIGGQRLPTTVTGFEIIEVLKGVVSASRISLVLPGGTAEGKILWIPGRPEFAGGAEEILFLFPLPGRDGEYGLTEFGLSVFDVMRDPSGRRFAVRTLFQSGAQEVTRADGGGVADLDHVREYEPFLSALRKAGTGLRMPLVRSALPSGLLVPDALEAVPEWVNIGGVEGAGNLFRWFWDTGASPNAIIYPVGTQTNLSDASDGLTHVQNTATAWAAVPSTDVRTTYSASSGNVSVTLDSTSTSAWSGAFCGSGIIGLGGPGSGSGPRSFKGDGSYFAPATGNVWMRKSSCSYDAATFRSAVLHEVGHALCLGHPDQSASTHSPYDTGSAEAGSAVMHSVITAARPDTPQTDDIAAMQYYYGVAVSCSSFVISPPSASPTASAGSLPVTVTGVPAGCSGGSWTASVPLPADASWLSVSPASGSGSGSVTVSWSANGTTSTRSGAASISGNTFTVNQAAVLPPTASFYFSPDPGVLNQMVSFFDASSGSPTSWSWNFGDPASGGSNTSTAQNPTHVFASAATYTVTMTASNASGPGTTSRQVSVTNVTAPVANFDWAPSGPVAGQAVNFYDYSSGPPTSWAWSFGDGGTSALANPTHAFQNVGTYAVRLTATNALGSSQVTKQVVVTGSGVPPSASFYFSPSAPNTGDPVQFSDSSTGGPTSWSWSFGDPASGGGNTSSAPNPVHSFAAAGNYTVTLTVSNAWGPNTATRGVAVGSATCTPSGAALCLLGGRFQVTSTYTDYGGRSGPGQAVPLTSDTGYFWFFGSSNVEVVAKMVSFCGSGTNNVAVYANGLTDVGVTIRVTDTVTGTFKDYTNALGTGFSLVRDGPFACLPGIVTAGAGAAAETAAVPARSPASTGETAAGAGAWLPLATLPGVPEASCIPDATSLCLLGGRFRVRSDYTDYGAGTGQGQAVPLTSDTGYFWFFSAANVEVVAKMVSFCGSGTNNVAVYANGLTDVGVNLTVTDTLTGTTQVYTNPLGHGFTLLRDGPFVCR